MTRHRNKIFRMAFLTIQLESFIIPIGFMLKKLTLTIHFSSDFLPIAQIFTAEPLAQYINVVK